MVLGFPKFDFKFLCYQELSILIDGMEYLVDRNFVGTRLVSGRFFEIFVPPERRRHGGLEGGGEA